MAANDWAITMNASASDLDLASNATVSFFALLQSLEMIGNGFALFSEKCVEGIVANEAVCRRYAEESTSLAKMCIRDRGRLPSAPRSTKPSKARTSS